jgi:hypothetical protein
MSCNTEPTAVPIAVHMIAISAMNNSVSCSSSGCAGRKPAARQTRKLPWISATVALPSVRPINHYLSQDLARDERHHGSAVVRRARRHLGSQIPLGSCGCESHWRRSRHIPPRPISSSRDQMSSAVLASVPCLAALTIQSHGPSQMKLYLDCSLTVTEADWRSVNCTEERRFQHGGFMRATAVATLGSDYL